MATEPTKTEAKLFSEKCHRFGILGAGIVLDSRTTLKLLAAQQANLLANGEQVEAPRPPIKKLEPGEKLTRQQILDILKETVRVQGIVQQEVSVLARKLAKDKLSFGDGHKDKLSFVEGHKKILELKLPREPLEGYGLTEGTFQRLLMEFEEDVEVMEGAQMLLHPMGKGDPERAAGISFYKVIEIHKFMVVEMEKVLKEFLELPLDHRRTFTGKGCETTAELLVSIAVEQQLSVRCEDVEQAVIRYEERLQGNPEFTRYTEQLANLLQHLLGAAQPRVEKAEFLQILQHMGDSTKPGKVFAKKLYEDYRAKSCNIVEAYKRFNTFSEEAGAALSGGELADLSSVELQVCYDEYKADEEVLRLWEHAGLESNLMIQASLSPMLNGSTKASTSSVGGTKGKRLKPSEIIEMQELMVDEMKRATEAAMSAQREAKNDAPWKAEITIQLVQSLASSAVERRYGTCAEDMTFVWLPARGHPAEERALRASQREAADILLMLAGMCGRVF